MTVLGQTCDSTGTVLIVGNSMGMGNPRGLWVWVPHGYGCVLAYLIPIPIPIPMAWVFS